MKLLLILLATSRAFVSGQVDCTTRGAVYTTEGPGTQRPTTEEIPGTFGTEAPGTPGTPGLLRDLEDCGPTTARVPECPPGWYRTTRPSGPWCMTVIKAPITMGYSAAAAQCKTLGGVLSGIQREAEMTEMLRLAKDNMISGSVWVGAKRTAACTGKKLSTTCSQKTSFQWTDGVTTGTVGFSWLASNQPDNAHGLKQNYIVAFFNTKSVVHKGTTWFPGAMDDVQEGVAQFTGPRQIGGYICGMKAT